MSSLKERISHIKKHNVEEKTPNLSEKLNLSDERLEIENTP